MDHSIKTSPNGSFSSNMQCTATQLLHWAGVSGAASAEADAIVFPMRRVLAETPLIHEGQDFEALYLVSGGSFKCVQTDFEGYEQVLEFAIHGDFLGLDGLGQAHHTSGAMALEDASVVVIPFREFMAASRRVPALESLLLRAAGAEVLRRGDTQYLMSAPRSEVRVARFLLQLAQRQAAIGYSDRRLRLCMTRRDIGSYLGVAHETVSRALSALADAGCIQVSQRDIEFIDLEALRNLQRVTRGRFATELHGAPLAARRGRADDGTHVSVVQALAMPAARDRAACGQVRWPDAVRRRGGLVGPAAEPLAA